MLEDELAGPVLAPPQTCAEIVRLAQAGMGVDKLGARFRLPYATIAAIVARERARPAPWDNPANAEAAAREYEGLP